VAFLRHAVRTLGLAVDVRRISIEEAPADLFDFALLRAVAAPQRSAELARSWVHDRGEVWIWAGAGISLPGAVPLPLASGGAILRVPAAAISRGTS
jgi:16S rRNA G527 N7-methylase RsmG